MAYKECFTIDTTKIPETSASQHFLQHNIIYPYLLSHHRHPDNQTNIDTDQYRHTIYNNNYNTNQMILPITSSIRHEEISMVQENQLVDIPIQKEVGSDDKFDTDDLDWRDQIYYWIGVLTFNRITTCLEWY